MLPYIIAAHAPALTCAEAARLPALTGTTETDRPRNLLIPSGHLQYLPAGKNTSRRGSAAGRAVLRARGITLPGMRAW